MTQNAGVAAIRSFGRIQTRSLVSFEILQVVLTVTTRQSQGRHQGPSTGKAARLHDRIHMFQIRNAQSKQRGRGDKGK